MSAGLLPSSSNEQMKIEDRILNELSLGSSSDMKNIELSVNVGIDNLIPCLPTEPSRVLV